MLGMEQKCSTAFSEVNMHAVILLPYYSTTEIIHMKYIGRVKGGSVEEN